ncbi:MAG: hypothetical protein H6673_04580 [Anaerolineales bacterium]|nr:hypothetical protein [Anaerolineales bacterium]
MTINTLDQLKQAINQLTPDELTQLQQHIDAHRQHLQHLVDDPNAWMAQLDSAVAAIREGLSEEEIQDMTDAMNAEYVNPQDLHQLESASKKAKVKP